MKKELQYRFACVLFCAMLMTGCTKGTEEVTSVETGNLTSVSVESVLPKAGEAVTGIAETTAAESEAAKENVPLAQETVPVAEETTDTEIKEEKAAKDSKKNNKKSKGTITVATVGSPNVEILQQAAVLLEENGYQLKVEVCEDYVTPNQMVTEGKVDCNYYQHKAFLDRYNIEYQTTLAEVDKVHYEPYIIYSEKIENLDQVENGMKVAISDNPTATARALWLLQDAKLITLMSDADINTVKDDIAENPYNLEIVFVEEGELVAKLQEIDLVICDKNLLMQDAIDDRSLFLAQENDESVMVQNLSHIVAATEADNANAKLLAEVLVSEEMRQFVTTKYQGSICIIEDKEENATTN